MTSKPQPTRQDDERLLDWLARRDRGESYRVIGRAHRTTKNTVKGQLCRIDAAMLDSETAPTGVQVSGVEGRVSLQPAPNAGSARDAV